MRKSIVAAFATLLAVAVSTSASAAEYVERSSWEAQQAQISQLEAELAALKSRLDAGVKPASYVEYNTSAAAPTTSGFSSATEGCTSCGDGGACGCNDCDFGCHPCGVYAGGAAVWMKPHFQDNIAITRATALGPDLLAESTSFDYDYEATGRVWLGYVAQGGLGIRGQYWQFDAQAPTVALADTGPTSILSVNANDAADTIGFTQTSGDGGAFLANHSLKLEIADLEATKRIYGGATTLVFSGGARYAQTALEFRAFGLTPQGQLAGEFAHILSFEGVGPTVALDLRRPIGWSPVSLIGGARGSVLFGNTEQTIFSVTAGGAGLGLRREAQVLSMLETQVGLEWAYHLAANGRLFVAGVVEAQIWQNAGSASLDTGDIGLIGFGFTAGIAR